MSVTRPHWLLAVRKALTEAGVLTWKHSPNWYHSGWKEDGQAERSRVGRWS